MASPIQIVLNPENYEEAREGGGGGRARDFFAHRDREFKTHKAAVVDQLEAVATTLRAQAQGNIGYVKVILRREAWAKSHRPLAALFRRSEEHTSELPSLMRISYAVFCLKKKTYNMKTTQPHT